MFGAGGSWWSFDNGTARNVIIFGHDSNNRKNIFLILGGGPTFRINGKFGSQRKFSINFTKVNTKFYLSLHYNAAISWLFICKWKKVCKFKADIKNVNFPG